MQHTCFVVSAMFGLLLIASKFHQGETGKRYESSRWLLATAMAILCVHFFLQMHFSLRASNDDIGTVVNIIFYIPAEFLISFSVVMIESNRQRCNKYAIIGLSFCALITIVFFVGWFRAASLDMELEQDILYSLFVLSQIYFVISPSRELWRNHKRVVDETGGDIQSYSNFSWATYLMMAAASLTLIFAIVYRPMLYIVAPFLFFTVFFYIISFVSLGYNITLVKDVLATDSLYEAYVVNGSVDADDVTGNDAENENVVRHILTAEQLETISTALKTWHASGGFRDSTVNMAKLSRLLGLTRVELSCFFEQHLNSTFRVWLSDIRFSEAKRLLLEHPEFGNDTISAECGFSSRSQLYKIFSVNTGLTPSKWKEEQQSAC